MTDKIRVIGFRCDYLKYNFLESYTNSEFASFFIGLSANSNYKDVKWFGYWFKATYFHSKGHSIIHFSYDEIPVIQIKKYDGQDMASQYLSYSVDFFGAYFSMPYLKSFYRAFYKKYGEIGRVSRLDIACDITCSMAQFEKAGWKTNYVKTNRFGEDLKTGIPETRYFGSKLGKNKRHLIRVYDKIKDIKFKKKFALHKDYLSYTNVIRIEVEIRSTSCRDYGLIHANIEDKTLIKDHFTTLCLNPKTTNLHILKGLNLEGSVIRKLSLKKEVKVLSKEDRIKRATGMVYNLFQDGYKNILIIIFNGMKEKGAYQNQEELLKLQKNITNYITK